MRRALKLSLCQIPVGANKESNLEAALKAITSVKDSSDIIVLPECWNSPYAVTSFPSYAEVVPKVGSKPDPSVSPSTYLLHNTAKSLQKWIVGGSIPEKEENKVFNTCVVFNDKGEIVGKHRKVHLFDINVPGKITFKESDSLTAGQSPTIIDTNWGKIGIGICYDIRFPEYAMLLRKLGAKVLIYPGAFNMTTGPMHWQLLQRARAVDNQLFVAACSPARDTQSGYIAWGHSSIVSPWGEVLAEAGSEASIVTAELNMDTIDEMRSSIPCWDQKRSDMYELISKGTH